MEAVGASTHATRLLMYDRSEAALSSLGMLPYSWEMQEASHPAPKPALIILLGALTAFSPLAIDMYLPAFPQIERELGAAPGRVPLTLSFFIAGLALGQFLIGPISDRTGRRLPLLMGCAGFSLAAAMCAFAPSVTWLIGARFCMGLAGAAGLVVSRAVVRDLFDEVRSASVYSFIMMVTGIAPVVAPLLGGVVLAVASWRAVFWVLATIGVVCIVAIMSILDESLPVERRARRSLPVVLRRSVGILFDGRFFRYGAAIGCTYGALFAYITAAPGVFMELYGLTAQRFSLLFASVAIGIYLAAQLNRWLLRRVAPQRILRVAAMVGAAAGCLLAAEVLLGIGGFYLFYATLYVCVATLGLIFPNATALAMAAFGQEAGTASAVLGLLQYAGGAAAAAAVAVSQDGTARPMAIAVAICETLVLIVIGMR